jgi:hypothetical protein
MALFPFGLSFGSLVRVVVSILAVLAAAVVRAVERLGTVCREVSAGGWADRLRTEVRWSKFQAVLGT